jgi:hypothetical protein
MTHERTPAPTPGTKRDGFVSSLGACESPLKKMPEIIEAGRFAGEDCLIANALLAKIDDLEI